MAQSFKHPDRGAANLGIIVAQERISEEDDLRPPARRSGLPVARPHVRLPPRVKGLLGKRRQRPAAVDPPHPLPRPPPPRRKGPAGKGGAAAGGGRCPRSARGPTAPDPTASPTSRAAPGACP